MKDNPRLKYKVFRVQLKDAPDYFGVLGIGERIETAVAGLIYHCIYTPVADHWKGTPEYERMMAFRERRIGETSVVAWRATREEAEQAMEMLDRGEPVEGIA